MFYVNDSFALRLAAGGALFALSACITQVAEEEIVLDANAANETVAPDAGEITAPEDLSDIVERAGPPSGKGMTWSLRAKDAVSGVVMVGCGSDGRDEDCNPYEGDMSCESELPLLCFRDAGYPEPASAPAYDRYQQWSGGVVATTPPAAASSFKTIAEADAHCATEFGEGWRLAEFHDGWGWNFRAYGGASALNRRFWVDINDQEHGVCWAR